MSTLKADAVTSKTTDSALTLSGSGTGGVKVNDYFVQTKGSDISSATSLTLGKDGNQFDVTGTTTITSIATQGIGSYVTLHFDGALTFTHHSTDLILPGAANITTAAGDIAVMYEYASADWRCVSYTKAAGTAVVAGGAGWEFIEKVSASSSASIVLGEANIAIGYDYLVSWTNVKTTADIDTRLQIGTGGTPTYQTANYRGQAIHAYNGTTGGTASAGLTSYIQMLNAYGGATAGEVENGECLFANPAEAIATHFRAHGEGYTNSGNTSMQITYGTHTGTAAITGFKFYVSSGDMTTGDFFLARRKMS